MELDLESQSRLVEALKRSDAFDHSIADLQHLQTHISHVLLAGDFAYKIKKPLDLGFLDFSTLARRSLCCAEELRLNSRLAGSVYLAVVPITGTLDRPRFGGEGPILDYAVRMRRFPQDALLSRREVDAQLIDRIAAQAAAFHAHIPAAVEDRPFGTPDRVLFPMQQNFDQIRPLLDDPTELARLDPLERWTRTRYQELYPLLARRKAGGHIRECHGDMHLGNIALVEGEVVIFDGIEFNPDLRWIDTMNEVAFLVMDLEQAGQQPLARRFLNRYLEISGDYEALALQDFYKVYRALVRAKVTAIRLGQAGLPQREREAVLAEYGRYLTLAESYTRPRSVALMITHGVSGSGKTTVGEEVLQVLGAVRVRSDVERKRLFGLAEDAQTGSETERGIYSRDTTGRTYDRLADLARVILGAGYSALVDATFLKRAQRTLFRDLARELACPFVILDLQARDAELRSRILRRQADGTDASEAGLAILDHQQDTREPLDAQERAYALALRSGEPLPLQMLQGHVGR
jgi:aminoglycoside phosphotransferase family enzyme/predicted kinase